MMRSKDGKEKGGNSFDRERKELENMRKAEK